VNSGAVSAAAERRKGGIKFISLVEGGVVALLVLVAVGTYVLLSAETSPELYSRAPIIALLLLANLLPATGLLVLIGRRVAIRRAERAGIIGGGRLHVRLVAIFSALASVPTILVVLFASLVVQYGVENWFSTRARSMLENATALARENYNHELDRISRETVAMRGDLNYELEQNAVDSKVFWVNFGYQIYKRELSEGAILKLTPTGQIRTIIFINPYSIDLENIVTAAAVRQLKAGRNVVRVTGANHMGVVVPFDRNENYYLYASRLTQDDLGLEVGRGERILSEYRALQRQSRSLQLKLNGVLLAISLLIVGVAVWIALQVADRLVRPVNDLVTAADRVASGDLSARVVAPTSRDELGTLARAFNTMTRRLGEQTSALVTANEQVDSRRAFMETVLSGVSAGVISVDGHGQIRLINASAKSMLATNDDHAIGQPLAQIAPELAALLDGDRRDATVQVLADGETRTLAVKIASAEAGPILTFDDITQQIIDQRRAAWSDVARRIAHEIKNPLTPIQLAAERLQRRYAKQIDSEDGVFGRLTETIVRQVGDLRRIVDEFSSFARMPKPVFREESLVDIGRQTLFLHEVAHPNINFTLNYDEPAPHLVCDRRQIGQALTNIVKNAAEAIDSKGEGTPGDIEMTISAAETGAHMIVVTDNGVGLPLERDRIVEPYMTTRSRGTGLGLAIVKKIVEEHFGTISFTDRPGGGTIVTLCFDGTMLAGLAHSAPDDTDPAAADRLAALTPIRNG